MATPTTTQKRELTKTLAGLLKFRVWPNDEPVTEQQAAALQEMLDQLRETKAKGKRVKARAVGVMTLES